MASWYKRFSKNLFMALASGGRYQTACNCDIHPAWEPGKDYLADSLVTHINPNTSEISLYRARGDRYKNEYLDTVDDEPGISIHWEFICSCAEIGFTPTPNFTPTPDSSPTPTVITEISTPTPTPLLSCEDNYEQWNPNQQHYAYKSQVYHLGKVYEARDLEGAEANDIPGKSRHWLYLFECSECVCAPDHYTTWTTDQYRTDFDGGVITGFVKDLKFSFNPNDFEFGLGVNLKIRLENSNVSGEVYIDGVEFPHTGFNLYVEYQNICYYLLAKSKNGSNEFELEIKSFPSICPTPTSREFICGEGFGNVYHTDGKAGSHEPKLGLSAELFDDGGKLYYNDLQISNLDEAMVYTSALWKNEVSGTPFGITVITGKFADGANQVVYESPDGTCWKGTIQPFGQNVVLYRIF
tara:strand:+ start:1192 stop:2421 length:1230 start_codon:yes stop_codon:yes gene_type:complete